MIAVLRSLWPYLRRHRAWLALAMGAMLGEVVTGLLAPWPLKYVVDSVVFIHTPAGRQVRTSLDAHALHLLILISVAALAIALLDGVFTYLDDRVTTLVSQVGVYELRRSLFTHLQRLSMAFHQHFDTQVGDLLSRLSGDIQALQDVASSGFSNLITNGLGLLTSVGVMLWLDWRLALVAVLFIVPMYLIAQRSLVKMRLALRTARRQEGKVSAVLQESLSSVKLVQAYGREAHEERRLATESTKSLEASLEAAALQSRLGPMVGWLSSLAMVAVTAFGVVLLVHRSITPGELLIFLGYVRGMSSPIRQLAKVSFGISKAAAGVERLDEAFARVPTVVELPTARELSGVAGSVRFENVSFGYGPEREIIKGVSLEVSPGQVVAIVGATGGGKSTLLSLLPRFFDPTVGRVLIDGVDVKEFTLASLRANISLVLQDSLIFRASLRENIAYGRPDAPFEEIEAAAIAASVDLIAQRLPDGYDTIVSERGSSLSGGEKQRIGIARALLKEAPIVILDEPTSSMDSLTERLVMQSLQKLLVGRTAFMIAHRLSTIRSVDLVAVLVDGRFVEVGPPDELLRRGGAFAELAQAQGMTPGRSRARPSLAAS
ncbi:MAG: ABC transporter ATP-binding protein [Actinomycetota bacterium]